MRSCQHRVTRASLLSAAASCSNQAPTETSATTGSTSATDVDSQRVLDCIRLLQWVTSPYRPSVHRPASPTVNDQSNRPRTNEGPGRPPAWLPASDAPGGCATLRRRTSVMRCPLGCSLACSVGRSVAIASNGVGARALAVLPTRKRKKDNLCCLLAELLAASDVTVLRRATHT